MADSKPMTTPNAALVEEAEVQRLLKVVYDDLPHKAISPALAKATGIPLGEVIPFDTAIAAGWKFDGYERTIRTILTALQSNTAQARAEALEEALTPSGSTKAAYMGEFHFPFEEMDDDGNEYTHKQYVPWTTIKEIMAAISARSLRALKEPGE